MLFLQYPGQFSRSRNVGNDARNFRTAQLLIGTIGKKFGGKQIAIDQPYLPITKIAAFKRILQKPELSVDKLARGNFDRPIAHRRQFPNASGDQLPGKRGMAHSLGHCVATAITLGEFEKMMG